MNGFRLFVYHLQRKSLHFKLEKRRSMELKVSSACFLLFLCMEQVSSSSIHGCRTKCGSLEISYPFGIGHGCSLSGFEISCNDSDRQIAFLSGTAISVLDISNGEIRIDSTPYIAKDCANGHHTLTHVDLPRDGPFTISDVSNCFMAIGCDTVAMIKDDGTFTSGCVSLCSNASNVINGSCTGVGCCESKVPKGKRFLGIGTSNMFGYTKSSRISNCSFAFLVERGGFAFEGSVLWDFNRILPIAMRLDWAIGNGRCMNQSSHICGQNSVCVDATRDAGYLCKCLEGYEGNPYLNGPKGCQDVNECLNLETNPCSHEALCQNRISGYICTCPFGSIGDGTIKGSGCRKVFQLVETVLGSCLGVGMILMAWLWFYFALKKRNLVKLREGYFRKNGGLLLKQQLSTHEGKNCSKIFSSQELKRATLNYDQTRIIGTGGNGTVYKGILLDGTVVAIKKSKVVDQTQIDQFINEVVVLTQINHRNVVKLLGCCLETQVPMLVYEFISNGTLYYRIHENRLEQGFPWKIRMKIAMETAEALAYLHSAASMPIVHRDVKSSNILLDENYTAKVADFGCSRLIPLDQTEIPTLVQGTLGYLDPEYFQSSQLTAKSDVYSFGVVLVELLTGQKPVSLERSREDSNLAMFFLSSLKSKELSEFLDEQVMREAEIQQLECVTELARKCLLLRGEKRPSMKEVAQELILLTGYRRCNKIANEEYEIIVKKHSLNLFNKSQSFASDYASTLNLTAR